MEKQFMCAISGKACEKCCENYVFPCHECKIAIEYFRKCEPAAQKKFFGK